ncbi:MAG: 30S ribosomal protein S20 [Clostridia bacterium]|nr:30S ribosomal protein S20 [Clostridia bacterium]
MANIKSAKKRISTNKRQRGENKFVKATIATMTKSFRSLVAEGKFEQATAKLAETVSYINSACSKGILHKNNASRKVARLSAHLDAAKKANGVVVEQPKPAKAPKKVEEKKEEVKAAAPKKAPAKKAATKSATKKEEKPAEKPAVAKKAPAKKPAAAKKPATAKKAPAKKAAAK